MSKPIRTTVSFNPDLNTLLREETERTGMSISDVVEWYILQGMEHGRMPSSRDAVVQAVQRIRDRIYNEVQ